ncbi:MAG: hypothetical protein DRR16_00490 [Candidatus Parabeggiatoa sp. nov. 3]|nr:MAG: hypothetical protein DRR00_01385 [Gammaproteobacteria bacterium]RKZ61899.1 MAG: hypothetical protein DRQ99_19650 [Gammaproteobacteria bacterium]RKZ90177.1 MAG: hypothetical protein DRR16_00490 [Gammaproteobacteria bacterium]
MATWATRLRFLPQFLRAKLYFLAIVSRSETIAKKCEKLHGTIFLSSLQKNNFTNKIGLSRLIALQNVVL